MRRDSLLLFSILALPTLAACGSGSGRGANAPGAPGGGGGGAVMCTMEARSSFAVTVTDSASGAAIRTGATVRVTEGTFSDTLMAPSAGTDAWSGGVYERDGTYTVAVSHPQYRPWRQGGVVVTKDECHVQTKAVAARLQRAE